MSRHEEREQAFILIFESLFNKDTADAILELAKELRALNFSDAYVETVFRGVCNKKEELSDIISAHLKGWTITRISKVSLAILFLAIFEMKYCDDIPDSVSINEAVELAKVYGCDNDQSFINGVLSSVYKQNNAKE